MASIKKTLSAKADINGMSQVLFYIVLNRTAKRLRVKSGVFVHTEYWNEKKHALTIPQKIDANLKTELQDMRDRLELTEGRTLKLIEIYGGESATKEFIETTLAYFKDYNGVLTREVVNDVIRARDAEEAQKKEEETKKAHYLFNFCQPYFDAKAFSVSRLRMVKGVLRSMERYEIFRNHIEKRPFVWCIDDVTRNDIEDLFAYFATEHLHRTKYAKTFKKYKLILEEERKTNRSETIEERGENRLVDMRKCVKAVWNWLIKTRRTTNNPFDGIEIGSAKYGRPNYLTKDERNTIANFDFAGNKRLSVQRDIFIFQCLTGCRVGDLTKLTADNIVGDILVYTPHKTKDENESMPARVPLDNCTRALLKKYKGEDCKGRLFPFIADQNYNEAIKDILTACGITRKVPIRNAKTGETEMLPINEVASSHMARRTFVAIAYKQVKDPNLVGRMSGHVEGSTAFVRYRDIDDDMLREVKDKMM